MYERKDFKEFYNSEWDSNSFFMHAWKVDEDLIW